MVNADGAGFYGKLPIVGDFVTRRLPRSFIDPWDNWLRGGIAASRAHFADAWLDVYLTSPIWRFVLKNGCCGDSPWAGATMPSVDRVGRYYPLTVACELMHPVNPFALATQQSAWFAEVEATLLSALEEDTTDIEQLDERVAAIGAVAAPESDYGPFAAPPRDTPWRMAIEDVNTLGTTLAPALDALTATQYGEYSLWWTSGSQHIGPSMLTCSGLPPESSYAALLGGGFAQAGWHESSVAPITSHDVAHDDESQR